MYKKYKSGDKLLLDRKTLILVMGVYYKNINPDGYFIRELGKDRSLIVVAESRLERKNCIQ
jgi:hypothetical protein